MHSTPTDEKDVIKGDQDKDTNTGLFQFTVEHMSGSFVTLVLICVVAVIYMVLKWRRRRKEGNPGFPIKAQFKRSSDNPTVRVEMMDQHKGKHSHESAIDVDSLPRVFLVANGENKNFDAH